MPLSERSWTVMKGLQISGGRATVKEIMNNISEEKKQKLGLTVVVVRKILANRTPLTVRTLYKPGAKSRFENPVQVYIIKGFGKRQTRFKTYGEYIANCMDALRRECGV